MRCKSRFEWFFLNFYTCKMLRKGANKIIPKKYCFRDINFWYWVWLMWGKTQVSFGTFGIYEQTNITVFVMTVAGSSAIPWQPPEAALYLGVIELCTSRLNYFICWAPYFFFFKNHKILSNINFFEFTTKSFVRRMHSYWAVSNNVNF